MLIEIPVAVAELFDKISILEIKLTQVTDPDRRKHAQAELDHLLGIVRQHQLSDFLNHSEYAQLRETNQQLWDLCEERRELETLQRFDQAFIDKSRLEYKTNDRRASVKQRINKRFDSTIVEVKSYKRLSHETD